MNASVGRWALLEGEYREQEETQATSKEIVNKTHHTEATL
jgi:hypothetical protein